MTVSGSRPWRGPHRACMPECSLEQTKMAPKLTLQGLLHRTALAQDALFCMLRLQRWQKTGSSAAQPVAGTSYSMTHLQGAQADPVHPAADPYRHWPLEMCCLPYNRTWAMQY